MTLETTAPLPRAQSVSAVSNWLSASAVLAGSAFVVMSLHRPRRAGSPTDNTFPSFNWLLNG